MVTWGRKETAGDREQIDSLRNVSNIQATGDRFAALCKDGSVVTWPDTKGQPLDDIREIQRNELCFAAIKVDGTLVTWGKTDFALDPTRYTDPPANLQGVRFLAAGPRAFAAVLNDRIVTWGNSCVVGDDVLVQTFGVKAVKSNGGAFAGLREDGTATRMLETLIQALRSLTCTCMLTHESWPKPLFPKWGNLYSSHVWALSTHLLSLRLFSSGKLKVVTWGTANCGGDSSRVQDQLKDVQSIQARRAHSCQTSLNA